MNLKFWRTKPKVGVYRQHNIDLDLKQWRANPDLVRAVKGFLDSDVGKAWLDMLANSSPLELVGSDFGVANSDRAYRLAKIEQHHKLLRVIQLSAILDEEQQQPLVATFAPENEAIG